MSFGGYYRGKWSLCLDLRQVAHINVVLVYTDIPKTAISKISV